MSGCRYVSYNGSWGRTVSRVSYGCTNFLSFPGGKRGVTVKTGLEMLLAFFVLYRHIDCPERKLRGGSYTRFEHLTAMNAKVTGFWNISPFGALEQRCGLFFFFPHGRRIDREVGGSRFPEASVPLSPIR
jgi:hypothetical protein